MSRVSFCSCWSSKDSHRKRAFCWDVGPAWPWISRLTIATVQELGEDRGRGIFYGFFPLKIFSWKY